MVFKLKLEGITKEELERLTVFINIKTRWSILASFAPGGNNYVNNLKM